MRDETAKAAADTSPEGASTRARRVMGFVLVILVVLLVLLSYLLYSLLIVPGGGGFAGSTAAPTETGELIWVRSIYGTSDQPEDLFNQTVAAAPDNDGSIWITQANSSQLFHFSADGRYLGSLASADTSSPLILPSRTAIGPDGLIYVCETTQDTVRVLNRDGTDAGSFGIPQPVSVAVSEDRIAVGSVYGFAILDKTGAPINVLGSRGKSDEEFDYVHGIAFDDDGNVYVSDSYNNRLSAYDRDGKRLWMVKTGSPANSASYDKGMLAPSETTGTAMPADYALQLPLGLTIDGAGRVVVIDMYECALAVFDAKTGDFVGMYGEAGADDGQMFYPVSVSYDPEHDWFTVADAFNKRVEIFRLPDSSGGVKLAASVKRALAGPARACVFPLILLLLALLVAVVRRFMARRVQDDEDPGPAGRERRARRQTQATVEGEDYVS